MGSEFKVNRPLLHNMDNYTYGYYWGEPKRAPHFRVNSLPAYTSSVDIYYICACHVPPTLYFSLGFITITIGEIVCMSWGLSIVRANTPAMPCDYSNITARNSFFPPLCRLKHFE